LTEGKLPGKSKPKTNYSGQEIIQIAMGEEEEAVAFYVAALETEQPPEVKELFQFLLGEETRHLVTLEKEISPCFQGPSFAWEDESLISAYLTASGRSGAIQEARAPDFVREHRSTQEIIDLAIGLERKSIDFYKALEAASSQSGKNVLRRVIEEEGQHIYRLNQAKKDLCAP